jgi:DNA repair exonuclease SbcCD nuclease subunit
VLRFFHTADIHLGASNQPVQYREQALPKLISAARECGVRTILVVGDVFDKAQPNQKIKDYLLAQIVNASDIHWIITLGNHDYANKAKDYHSLMTYAILEKNVKNVSICEVGVHEFYDFTIVVMPDKWNASLQWKLPITLKLPIIAAWHGLIPGKSIDREVGAALGRTGADYIALGDFHVHKRINERCWYPGALTQKTYACEDGYVLVEISGNKIRTISRHLDLPKRFNLSIGFDAETDTAETVIDAVRQAVPEGNLVRLKFELPLSQWALLNRKKISEGLRSSYLEIKFNNDAMPENVMREWAKKVADCKTIHDEIKVIVDLEDTTLDKANILMRCESYLGG